MPRALSIYLPRWPIQRAMRRRLRQTPGVAAVCAADSRKPTAVMLLVSSDHGSEFVSWTCERAEAAGVRAGMTVAHARALLCDRETLVEPHAPDEDARQLRLLARWALRFTPIAAPDEPDGLLLDIAGCAHLYGGEAKLAEHVATSVERLGLETRVAIAPTFACAQAVARRPGPGARITLIADDTVRESLAPLPIAALRVNAATCEALDAVGIERIEQLLDLPRPELAARFGRELLQRMDQALGHEVSDPMEPVRPCEPLEVSRIFDGPVACLQAVQAACRELLTLLVRELGRRERGVCLLTFSFRRIGVTPVRLALRLTHPSRDEAHLGSLLRPRLERLHLGYGIEEIHLRAVRTESMGHKQIELEPPSSGGWLAWSPASRRLAESRGRLLDQLIERLGADSVHITAPRETYVPEQAFVFRPWTEADGPAARRGRGGNGPQVYLGARPSRLFPKPETVRVITLTPDGPLVKLQWRGRDYAVRRCLGPERIELPWWTVPGRLDPFPHSVSMGIESMARPAWRDYYTIQEEQGDWLWLFRDQETSRWFVHGEWA